MPRVKSIELKMNFTGGYRGIFFFPFFLSKEGLGIRVKVARVQEIRGWRVRTWLHWRRKYLTFISSTGTCSSQSKLFIRSIFQSIFSQNALLEMSRATSNAFFIDNFTFFFFFETVETFI